MGKHKKFTLPIPLAVSSSILPSQSLSSPSPAVVDVLLHGWKIIYAHAINRDFLASKMQSLSSPSPAVVDVVLHGWKIIYAQAINRDFLA